MRRALAILVLAVFGCGDDDGGGQSDPDASVGGNTDAAVQVSGYAMTPTMWSVPGNSLTEGFGSLSRNTSPAFWATIDIDGDGKLDLVHTGNPDDAGIVFGRDPAMWKVYLNEGTAFASTPVDWSVPAIPLPGYLSVRRQSTTRWTTLDIDGDGKPDLVLTTDPATGDVWDASGSPHWKIHMNTGSGFATAQTDWPVPTPALSRGFFDVDSTTGTVGFWQTIDVNGDGRPDLVHTADAGVPPNAFGSQGSHFWKVYLNTGSGFGAEMMWSVPDAGVPEGFHAMRGPTWETLDIDNDGALELVHSGTEGVVFYEQSQPVWRVYEITGSGTGFEATSRNWAVPLSSESDGFFRASANSANQQWTTVDIDNDGNLDLVHTAITTRTIPIVWGSPDSDQWKVYFGDGTGFSRSVISWQLPDSGDDFGLFGTAVNDGIHSWAIIDIDGDGTMELVQAGEPTSNGSIVWDSGGAPHWRVYRAP